MFLPNYNVSLAEQIIPAADLSEQISTAGMEASGTGNMKLALNGALTIGTLDGANVEIRDCVGAANIFIFGLTAEQVESRRRRGLGAHDQVAASPALAQAIEAVRGGVFSPGEPDRYAGLMQNLLERDTFMVASDFDSYVAAQEAVDRLWRDPAQWWRASILQHGRRRLVLVRPHHRRIRARHLGHPGPGAEAEPRSHDGCATGSPASR